jgi:ribonuclease VapC
MASGRVLDSWAMMAFFETEPAAARVEQIILDAHQADAPLLMSVVNVGELWYATARAHSPDAAEKALQALTSLRIAWVNADWEITRQAAAFGSRPDRLR